MPINDKQKITDVLTKTAEALDIPGHVYEDAVLKYESVGAWLSADDSELKDLAPAVYPQGSFRLGTVIRPIAKYDYDIDLVCLLDRAKDQTTQKKLKDLVGDRLKKHPDLKGIVSPGCRCWLLDYPAESNLPAFHMDVLPSIPNTQRPQTGILLTDRDLIQWQKSNPKAYADWFSGRMKTILLEKIAAAARDSRVNVEDVPEWQIKTPLQIAVQLLKRHRDVYFASAPDDRPISIIITTLAAHAYRNQPDVHDALIDITRDMEKFIQQRDGHWWIPNPVEPEENFADRWNQYPGRRNNFVRWLEQAKRDFVQLAGKQRLEEVVDSLRAPIGTTIMAKVERNLGLASSVPAATVPTIRVAPIGDISHRRHAPWSIYNTYNATMKSSVHYKKNGRKLWPLADRILYKNLWLRFELETNTPPPFEIAWQVVNTGKEAADAGQLRGTFDSGDGIASRVHWERSLYRAI